MTTPGTEVVASTIGGPTAMQRILARTQTIRARSGALAAAGIAAVGLGVLAAPSASGGPAPWGVEDAYVDTLFDAGVIAAGQEQDALTLGYLTCALRKSGSQPVAGTEVFLGAARLEGLCDYTPTPASLSQGATCPRSGAWSVECSLAQGTLQNTSGVGLQPSMADGVVEPPFP
jgi:hypothetical protein